MQKCFTQKQNIFRWVWKNKEGKRMIINNYISPKSSNRFIKWIEWKSLYCKSKRKTEKYLKSYYDSEKLPLFSSIEIEVINRCNGECPF